MSKPPSSGESQDLTLQPLTPSLSHSTPAGLPTCVQQAREAADRLHHAILHSPFPDLNPPTSDDGVSAVCAQVIDWGRSIVAAYGDSIDSRRSPNGLITVLRPKRGRRLLVSMPNEIQMLLRCERDWTSFRSALDHKWTSPLAFSVRTAVTTPRLDSAESVLGVVPSLFVDTFAHFARPQATSSRILDEGGVHPLESTISNWPRIQRLVLQRYQLVVAQALGLLRWVRDRIRLLDQGLLLGVRIEQMHPSGGATLIIAQAGATRRHRVSKAILTKLRALAAKGEVFASAKQKLSIVNALPELRPHLLPSRNLGLHRSIRNMRYYSAPAETLRGFQLDAPAKRNPDGNRKPQSQPTAKTRATSPHGQQSAPPKRNR